MNETWVKQHSKPQPMMFLMASTHKQDYDQLGYELASKPKSIRISVMADTGCQSCLAGLWLPTRLGVSKEQLIPVQLKMSAANKSVINILGAAIIRFSGQSPDGRIIETRQLVYITDTTDRVYLSKEACTELGIISGNFPRIGEMNMISSSLAHPQEIVADATNSSNIADCGCPRRSLPPRKPTIMPFEVKSEGDVTRLKKWLLDLYKSSSFNTCTHQRLPMMTGPPLRLMIDESVEPDPKNIPIPIPFYWMDAVKAGLDQDVRLGVIKPVPVGDPVGWCHHMVVCAKKNGKPRRTVDFQALNKHAKRETHHTQAPYIQARSVPPGKLKTVFDCWNGYHSIPLHEDDYRFTTFITPWGRYQYRVAPQGYIASGDGYSRRFDEIVADVPNKTKCIDDTLLWASTIEESFMQAVNWLDICGRNGVVLNPEKFTFAQETVDFAGFTITNDSVKPTAKYLAAIRDFPTPSNLTDIRSWFGVVNQVAYAFAAAETMQPFRELLKSKAKFYWNDELESVFQKSKSVIISKIEKGVRIFDKTKPTCLTTDWSKTGIGYWLLQKHCNCQIVKPFCCRTGWKITLVGSRFTHTAESRYAPVEGEALAVAYALDHARHFVLGCAELLIAVDHKPLLSIFGERSIDSIPNTRLRNLKEKTLRYRFKMVYIPGAKHKATDAVSRKPAGSINPPMLVLPDDDTTDEPNTNSSLATVGEFFAASRQKSDTNNDVCLAALNAMNSIQAVTWDRIKIASSSDGEMESLLWFVQSGFPQCKGELPQNLQVYFQHRMHLSSVDGVVLYKNRIIVPQSLREVILSLLHSAHQGVTRMTARAEASIFWPGITADIERTRLNCSACNKITPSQPSAPPQNIQCPSFPFQMISADFFSYKGKSYLVIVDRYSNWPIIERSSDGSKGLVDSLRRTFSTFGIPDELASDGGTEFTAQTTKKFLNDWGIHHRISSVAFPHSNCRAEIGVKTAKRMIIDNTDHHGNLNLDAFQRAILVYRNTPAPDTDLSPAQCVFGRPIKDFIPIPRNKYHPHPTWVETLNKREEALKNRHQRMQENWSLHTKKLTPLKVGDTVRIQNQVGSKPRHWDKTGMVVEVRQYDQYLVRVDGSGRISMRNRKFLRKYERMFPRQPKVKLSERLRNITASRPLNDSPYQRYTITDNNDCPEVVTSPSPSLSPESFTPELPDHELDSPPAETLRPKPKLAVRRLADFNKKGLRE